MNCETGSRPIDNPDLTKYLIASSQGNYESHYMYRNCEPCQLRDYPTYGSVSRFCSVDKNTGKKIYGGSNSGDFRDATAAIPNLRLSDLPGIYRDRIESVLPSLKGLPGPTGPVDVTLVFSPDGGVPSVTWSYSWGFTGGGEENGAPCTITRNGSYSGTISLDLAGGSFTYNVSYSETFSWVCDDDGTSGSSWDSSSRTETISMTATTVSRQTTWDNRSGNGDAKVALRITGVAPAAQSHIPPPIRAIRSTRTLMFCWPNGTWSMISNIHGDLTATSPAARSSPLMNEAPLRRTPSLTS